MFFMERNYHGFAFEQYVEEKFGVNRAGKGYTSKWDGCFRGVSISIKHIKKGNAIDLGDLFRQASIEEDFFLIIGFYEKPQDFDRDSIYFLYVPGEKWKTYFISSESFQNKFKNALFCVSNDKKDDAKWTKLRQECVKYWKENTNGFITVNGKRDHKSQKRWQCSINKTNFYKEFLPKYEITKEEFLNYAKRDEK